MIVLAIDTATPHPAVALVGGVVESCVPLPADREASERLLPAMKELLRTSGVSLSRVDRLVGLVGPGSFTGIRIGLASIWALARALGTAVESMTTLEAIAETARPLHRRVAVFLDAGRGDYWGGLYDLSGKRAVALAEPRLLAGTVRGELASRADVSLLLPAEPLNVLPALAAARAVARRTMPDHFSLRPLYLRKSAAEERRGTATS